MKYKLFTLILFSFIGSSLTYAMQTSNDQELTTSIHKSRLAAIDFLQPVIYKIEDEHIITQLKDIQNNIFDNLSQIQTPSYTPKMTTKGLNILYDWDFLTKTILEYCPAIPLKGQLMQNFYELGDVLQSKSTKKEPLLFLVELSDQVKKAELSKIYRERPSQENMCSHCHNGWTMCTKVLGDTVKECLFCGHDEILSYPRQYAIKPHISGRIVEWLHNLGEDFYVKIALDKTNPLNEEKSRPILFSDVICLNSYSTTFEGVIPQHGVLLDSGSHIEVQIKSNKPGSCGFIFAIHMNQEKITDRSHCIDTEGKNQPLITTVRKHQQTKKTFNLDDFKATPLKNNEDKATYLRCDINGWKIKSFKKDDILYPTSKKESEMLTKPKRESAKITGSSKDNTVHERHELESKFGNISDIVEDKLIGSLTLNFYIFTNPEDKGRFYEAYEDIDLSDF